MAEEDDDDDDSQFEDPLLGRDQQGRFKKGFSGNPRGRPQKEPELSQADPFFFRQTLIDVVANARMSSRHGAKR